MVEHAARESASSGGRLWQVEVVPSLRQRCLRSLTDTGVVPRRTQMDLAK